MTDFLKSTCLNNSKDSVTRTKTKLEFIKCTVINIYLKFLLSGIESLIFVFSLFMSLHLNI